MEDEDAQRDERHAVAEVGQAQLKRTLRLSCAVDHERTVFGAPGPAGGGGASAPTGGGSAASADIYSTLPAQPRGAAELPRCRRLI